jgi:hypothetical protein
MTSSKTPLPLWEFSDKENENQENFKLFKQAWNNFEILNFDEDTTEKVKIAWLESALNQNKEAIVFYNSIEFTTEEKKTAGSRIKVIEDKVKPTKSKNYDRMFFKTTKQEENESVQLFAERLKKVANDCDFGANLKQNLCDQFVFGLKDSKLQKELLKKETFEIDTVVKECKLEEALNKRLEDIKIKQEPPETVNKITTTQIDCKFCGYRHVKVKEKCPAWNKKCNLCGKLNHFAKKCLARTKQGSSRGKSKKQKNMKVVEHDESSDDEEEEEINGLEEVRTIKKKATIRGDLLVLRNFGKACKLNALIDTGASCCVIGEKELKEIVKKPSLNRSNAKLRSFSGHVVKPIGTITLKVRSGSAIEKISFQVISGSHEAILSCEASQKLGFISVHKVNRISCNNSAGMKQLDTILEKYKEIFVGDGKMKSEVSLEVDDSVSPVQEKPRRIPVNIRHRLEKEIKDLSARGLIEKVVHPVKWTSNIVVVRKKNKDQIRICLDPKHVNEALIRKKYQIPTIEEVLPELSQAKVFSLLDCKNGFLQVPLQESSRDLTSFWTPFGIYRWKVLPFGISCAPEIFQQKQCEIVQGLKGVEVIADDILVYGVGEDFESALIDHNSKMERLLERLTEQGVKLNKEKAQIAKTSLKFYGHWLTDKGVLPDAEKIAAITKATPPKTIKELECFLGMIAYHQKFIQNLSAVTEPLRAMLKSKVFNWNVEMQKTFDKLKFLVSNRPILRYFDVNKEVVIQTDASRKGLGGVLLQENHPVIYVSKALTKTEEKYAIIELELLAILFTCKRLDQYICGKNNITVETDHLPLRGIMAKPLHQCSKRIQRMRLELLKYDIKVKYRPGKEMVIPDYLSRNPMSPPEADFEENDLVMKVLSLVEKVKLGKVDMVEGANMEEIKRHTKEDKHLQSLMEIVKSGSWEKVPQELSLFKAYLNEISLQDGLIFKGNRVLIPKTLRKKYLNLLHIGHQD